MALACYAHSVSSLLSANQKISLDLLWKTILNKINRFKVKYIFKNEIVYFNIFEGFWKKNYTFQFFLRRIYTKFEITDPIIFWGREMNTQNPFESSTGVWNWMTTFFLKVCGYDYHLARLNAFRHSKQQFHS